GPPGDGRAALWVHLPSLDMSAAALAIVGDFVPFGVGQALGARAGGNSLDNTLRVVTRHPTEWILADVRVHAVEHGFGHGLVHLWAEDGTLLATASQSAIVREHRDWGEDDAAAARTPSLRLGTAIVPAYTRGAATLAETVASMVQAAPGRFALGIGTSSNVIVENWNGIPFEEPYRRVRDTIRFLRTSLAGEKVTHEYDTFA